MSTVAEFLSHLDNVGSTAIFHREDGGESCPCLTLEGFRDPIWHFQNPGAPVCNDAGKIAVSPMHLPVKAWIQPIQSTRATRLQTEQIIAMFGEFQADDHLGIFPVRWSNTTLDFYDWGRATEDWVEYDDRRYTVVNANKLPDPSDGNPDHHWECALRLI